MTVRGALRRRLQERSKRKKQEKEAYESTFREAKIRALKERGKKEGRKSGLGGGSMFGSLGGAAKAFDDVAGTYGPGLSKGLSEMTIDPFERRRGIKDLADPKRKAKEEQ